MQLSPQSILEHFYHLKKKPYMGQFSSLSHVRLCNPMDCGMPGFPVHCQLLELAQTHVHRDGNATSNHLILLSSPSPSPPIGVDKQNMVYTYNRILFSLKKEVLIYYDVDEPWIHFVKWNKPVTKDEHCMIPLIWVTQSIQIHGDITHLALRGRWESREPGKWGATV